jgi:L-alanine-DL-glutamate epimerase-like enolase superfamily enzyme
MMGAHFAAVVPNLRIMEYDPDMVPWQDDLVTVKPDVRDGHLHLPTGPGWGTEVNEEAVRGYWLPARTSWSRVARSRSTRRIATSPTPGARSF